MEQSQDLTTAIVAKRRGRKPKSQALDNLESTLPETTDMRASESENVTKRGRKKSEQVPKTVTEERTDEDTTKETRKLKARFGSSPTSVIARMAEESSDEGLWTQTVPASSYEWLGLRTVEPTSRQPLLKLSAKNESRVAWANRDCALSSAMLRRARPLRPLEAAFFDRLELMRRVALSEVAKANDLMEAVAVLGIVFDREALMMAAEEVYGAVKGKELLQDANPGNYDELAMKIATDRKPRRFTKRKEIFARNENVRGTKVQSKATPPYFTGPFRGRGTKVLYSPWCPRASSTVSTPRRTEQSRHRLHESSMEGMEIIRRSKTPISMVAKRSSSQMERSGAGGILRRGQYDTERRGETGDGTAPSGWRIQAFERRGHSSLASILDPEEIGREAINTRSEGGKSPYRGSTFHTTWRPRCGDSGAQQQLVMRFRSKAGLSAGVYGERCEEVPRREDRREHSGINGTPIWASVKPIHIHEVHQLASWISKKGNRSICGCLHRRLFNRVGDEREAGERIRQVERFIQGVRRDTFGGEVFKHWKGGGVPWISVVSRIKDGWNNGLQEERIQESNEESVQGASTSIALAQRYRKASLLERSGRSHAKAREEPTEGYSRKEIKREGYSLAGSQRRLVLVGGRAVKEAGDEARDKRNHGVHHDGCIGKETGLHPRDRGETDRKNGRNRRREETHKYEGTRSIIQMFSYAQRYTERKKHCLVYRQCHGKSVRGPTGDTEDKRGNMGNNEEDIRQHGRRRNKNNSEACPGFTKWSSRFLIQTRRREGSLGECHKDSDKPLGPARSRPIWIRKATLGTCGRFALGKQESSFEAEDIRYPKGARVIRIGKECTSREDSPFIVGRRCGTNYTNLAKCNLVEAFGTAASGLAGLRKNARQESISMAGQKWARAVVDSLFNSNSNPVWAERTIEKYRRTIERYLWWLWIKRGNSAGNIEVEESKEQLSKISTYIKPYLEALAMRTSGESVYVAGKTLLRILGNWLPPATQKELREDMWRLRHITNMNHPPRSQAADAVTLEDLRALNEYINEAGVSAIEITAVEVLTVAFATMSRVAEIVALEVDDVDRDGGAISIRAKTDAATNVRNRKKVVDGCGLYPREILRTRRARAVLGGRRLLFHGGTYSMLSSAQITNALKRICGKRHMAQRITAHSGRKGAAVAALLAGVPVIAIQGLGLWKCLDSLQAYLGKSVREQFGVLQLIER